jgi:uncharacterized protein (DUF2252 family)
LQDDRRRLLERFDIVDMARKVVGVGSVGTRAFIVLLLGRDAQDLLLLQITEATASVLEAHLPKSRYRQHGQRVVEEQRMRFDDGGGGCRRPVRDRDTGWRRIWRAGPVAAGPV